ncbi:MAG: prephenate dehydratase [Candidatus Omnitrophica bacterium]|nr:prephenate dehydratase [Candidatus Omnitrophota bacterium]
MNLDRMRKQIDSIDTKIVRLLDQRAGVSRSIGDYKRKKGEPVYVPDREQRVLDRIQSLSRGSFPKESLRAVYAEIMSGSLKLEKGPTIAYLGPEFTFAHQASVKKFGRSVRYVPCDSIADIFTEVENGRCTYGVAPVENSTEGAVYHTLDSFIDSDLKICSEVVLRIHLDLLSVSRQFDGIRKIYSHPHVFGQCRTWLEANVPQAEMIAVSSTAAAARVAARNSRSACIASRLAAVGRLRVLAESIQDNASNVTRFLVLSRHDARPTRSDKTSIVFSVKDQPGALHQVLLPFKKRGINLTKIESRPSKTRRWDYYFFVDIESHASNSRIAAALKEVEAECAYLKILGSYPKSSL